MVNSAQVAVKQQGAVSCWGIADHTEMAFAYGWVKQQVGKLTSGRGHVRLELVGYESTWTNPYCDKANKIVVQLRVLSISGSDGHFTYTGLRTVGTANGDRKAAERAEGPECFEIHVIRSPQSKDPRRGKIAVSWKRIPQPC